MQDEFGCFVVVVALVWIFWLGFFFVWSLFVCGFLLCVCLCAFAVLFGIYQLNGEEKSPGGNLGRFWLEADFKDFFMTANLLQRIKEMVGRASRSRIN